MEQNCKWRASGARVVSMGRIIKDLSVQIFVLSSVKVIRKTISEEIAWVFFLTGKQKLFLVNIQQWKRQNEANEIKP